MLVLVSLPILSGCPLLGKDEESEGSDSTTNLATSDLAGDWDTPCIAKGTMAGPTGYAGYRDWLSVTGTDFFVMRAWYSTMTGAFCTGSMDVDATVEGTVAVGGLASGSSTLSEIQFTITSAEVRGYTAGTRTILNNACALALASSTPASVLGNVCGGGGYTSNPSNNAQVDNVVSKSGTTLMMGAMETSMFIPGVLNGNPVPTSATVTFIKR